ncbi:MAG: class I SAM-dependent methyltransferase [Pirellulaceae bacterium]|nr:class I SAM-dependent methyltransferase [Pirellulaceae bacterium]
MVSGRQALAASWYDFPQYYDMAFRDETRREADFIEAACRKYCPFPVRRLLEPACGTGRLIVELASRGYEMSGFDLRGEPLRYLRHKLVRRGLRAELFQADMADFRPPQPVDAAHNTWNSFRYLLSEQAARRHLQRVAQSLRPGGIYILGFHLLPLDADEECTERWTARHAGTRVAYTLRVLATDRRRRRERLRISLLVRRGTDQLRLRDEFQFRMYTASQFRRLLRQVPELELCDVYDFWYDIDQPLELNDEISDTLFILRRKGRD